MRLRIHLIDLDRMTATYSVWNDAGTVRIFGENEAVIPPGANTLAEIKAAVRPQARLVGQSFRDAVNDQASLVSAIDTDPLP